MRRTIIINLIAGLLWASWSGCVVERKEGISKEALIQQRLQEKIDRWHRSIEAKCEQRITQRASDLVDSLLIARARQERDTSLRPVKPIKPLAPGVKHPKDSLPVAPLVRDTSHQVPEN